MTSWGRFAIQMSMNWKNAMYAQMMTNVNRMFPRSFSTLGERTSLTARLSDEYARTMSEKANAESRWPEANSGPKMVERKPGSSDMSQSIEENMTVMP